MPCGSIEEEEGLTRLPIADCQLPIERGVIDGAWCSNRQLAIGNRQSHRLARCPTLLQTEKMKNSAYIFPTVIALFILLDLLVLWRVYVLLRLAPGRKYWRGLLMLWTLTAVAFSLMA